jgi:ABC-type multidrug transport system permease subunit
MTTASKRVALGAIVISTLAIGCAYASAFRNGGPPVWAGWLFAAGVTGALVATLALGAMRPDRGLGRLIGPFLLMTGMISAGFIAVFALPDLGVAEPLLLGLPRRAAIVLYGIGLLPTLVLPVAYALTFADHTLRPEDLERVLATARSVREARAMAKE